MSKADQLRALREAKSARSPGSTKSDGGVEGHAQRRAPPEGGLKKRPDQSRKQTVPALRKPGDEPLAEAKPGGLGEQGKPVVALRKAVGIKPGPSDTNPAPKLKRGRPKIEGNRPWEAEGVSRRTWYRRKGKA